MADEGATPRELLLEACRRNNTELLHTVFTHYATPDSLADFLNTATDALGASALHIAAQYGSYEILDLLLDQEGLEIDGQEKRDGDTALHKAIRFVNGLDRDEWEGIGTPVVEILLDAGCDTKTRNKAKLKAFDLVDPRNEALRGVLRKAEMMEMAKGDIVDEDEDEGGDGPPSDSD